MLSVASFLLTCMMLAAVVIRMRIKERAVKMLPALLYVILNSILFYNSIS